jgi:hypothetical protein
VSTSQTLQCIPLTFESETNNTSDTHFDTMILVKGFTFLFLLSRSTMCVQAACLGSPWSCGNYPSEDDCTGELRNIATGCSWEGSVLLGTCSGTPFPCSSFSDEDCERQEGCGRDYWCDLSLSSPEYFCVKEQYPNTGFKTVYRDCPISTGYYLSCDRCTIYETDSAYNSISFSNPNQCTSCTLCSDLVAWDCSNLASGPCSIKDCDGNCIGSGSVGDSEPTLPPASQPGMFPFRSSVAHPTLEQAVLVAMMIMCALY